MKYLVQPIVCHSVNTPGTDANKARTYAIIALQHGLAVTMAPGTKLQPQPWTAAEHQTFRFIPVDGQWCMIEVMSSGKVLQVTSASLANGASIGEADRTGATNQQFRLVEAAEGRTFLIEARHSGKVLDIADYRQGAGGTLYQYERHGRDNQQWLLTEVKWNADIADLTATIYADENFQGASQPLGLGSFDLDKLRIGNDVVSSIKIPAGLRVTIYEHSHFNGARELYYSDVASLGAMNDKASSILVEKVATLHSGSNYSGNTYRIGVGRYLMKQLVDNGIGNDHLKALRVPQGLMVILYQHDKFTGDYVSVTEDRPNLPSPWMTTVSSVIVKQTGTYIPDDTLRYGGKIEMINIGRARILDPAGGALALTNVVYLQGSWFKLVRSGPTTLGSHVCYGDIVSLQSASGKYVVAEKDGTANVNRDNIGEWEKWEVIRSGTTATRSFVCLKDIIALRSIAHNRLLVANENNGVDADATSYGDPARWRVTSYQPPNAVPSYLRTSACGSDACAANVCPAETCGGDACAAAACSAAAALVSACVAAASGLAACGMDVAAAAVGGISACVAALTGVGVCGADACGAALCGAATCGAAACGAAACGADACGAAANGASGCVTNAGGIDACGADACVANVCGINICPVDACAVDACAIDVVPILPFI